MKKLFIIAAAVGLGLVVGQGPAKAAVYQPPVGAETPYQAGNCVMVSTRAEADENHVYTLNPTHAIAIAQAYRTYINRYPRCEEVQFQVDHNTTIPALQKWLTKVATSYYKNLASSPYVGRTVSTSRHEWYYIDRRGAHRISDWLTALSHGVLVQDRLSIAPALTNAFYNNAEFSDPLVYHDGLFYPLINQIWKEGRREYSGWIYVTNETLRDRMVAEMDYFVKGAYLTRHPTGIKTNVFQDCEYVWGSSGDPYGALLDWSWMASNPGCHN